MAIIFRDRDSKEILRIDYGEPDPEAYAQKEGLENWEAEKVSDDEALELIPIEKVTEIPPGQTTLEERVRALEREVFKI